MRKWSLITLPAAGVILLGGLIFLALTRQPRRPAPPDLVYARHPLSYWLDVLSGDPPDDHMLGYTISSLDSNAVPYLIWTLQQPDGPTHTAWLRFWPHLPGWVRNRVHAPNNNAGRKRASCAFLCGLYTYARPAIPELVRVLRDDDDWGVRWMAASTLRCLAISDDEAVLKALAAAAAKDPVPKVRDAAANTLMLLNLGAKARAGQK